MIAIGNFTRSSSFRVGALLTSLAVAAIIFIVYFWRIASSDVFLREAKAAVNAEAYAYAMVYEYQGVEGVVRAMSERGLAQWSISDDTIVALQASSGELLGGNVTSWPNIESVQTMGNDGQGDTQTALITATPIIDAAIYENGKVGCLFTDENEERTNESQLIEQLQWRIIDTTTDSNSYSILVYAATVQTRKNKSMDAIAINTASPNDEEGLLLYPYYRVGEKIVISPPISTKSE